MAIDAPMVAVHRRLGPSFAVLQVARRQDLRVQIWIEGALVDWEVRDRFQTRAVSCHTEAFTVRSNSCQSVELVWFLKIDSSRNHAAFLA